MADPDRRRALARHLATGAAEARRGGRFADAERMLQHALDLLGDVIDAADDADRVDVTAAYVALLVALGRDADAARLATGRR